MAFDKRLKRPYFLGVSNKEEQLISTRAAAASMGVGTTSVKRWADEGLLACIRTAGGHRRFRREDVDNFIRSQQLQDESVNPGLSGALSILIEGNPHRVESEILAMRGRLGSWHRVMDELAPLVTDIGLQWERGELRVADEHLAIEQLGRTLSRIGLRFTEIPHSPICLLATVADDVHTVGLSFAEVTLREVGWRSLWLGRTTPVEEIIAMVNRERVGVVALSASAYSSDSGHLQAYLEALMTPCRLRGTKIVVGGSGDWPEPVLGVERLKSFTGFSQFLRRLNPN